MGRDKEDLIKDSQDDLKKDPKENLYGYFYTNTKVVITPQNISYNVKKCSEGFSFERLY